MSFKQKSGSELDRTAFILILDRSIDKIDR